MSPLDQRLDQLLSTCAERGITLWLDSGKLRFRAPTGALDEGLKASLQALKPELIRRLSSQEAPLAFTQQRLWFLEKLEAGSETRGHQIVCALQIEGCDTPAITQALNRIRARHDILRTDFPEREGLAVQRISPPDEAEFPCLDGSELSASRLDSLRHARLAALTRQAFALDQGPPMRIELIRLAPDRHQLLLVIHHILADGWSVGLLLEELRALIRDPLALLPPLPLQYADHARAERERLASGQLQSSLEFWRQTLAGAPSQARLPYDFPEPDDACRRGGEARLRIPPASARRLEAFALAQRATPFMVLLAAYSALLQRFTAENDWVIGTPIAGRDRAELFPLIGYFANTLAIRCRLDQGLDFFALTARVREAALAAFAHGELPFERVVEAIRPERRTGQNPIFQTMFALQNDPRLLSAFGEGNPRLTPIDTPVGLADFDLTLNLYPSEGGYSGGFEYRRARFLAETVESLARVLPELLDALLAQPERPLEQLALSTNPPSPAAHESREAPDPLEQIRATAQAFPSATALETSGSRLSYAELWSAVEALAAGLMTAGVGPERQVALLFRREPAAIAALLAVLLAGGSYLPLDPETPPKRLARLLLDSQPALLLLGEGLEPPEMPEMPEQLALEIYRLDRQFQLERRQSRQAGESPLLKAVRNLTPASAPLLPSQAAYLIYTSGSTGTPRGVLVTRAALAHFCASAGRAYEFRPGERVLQFASLSFDAAIEEIFPTLCAGATLVLRDEDMLRPERLLAALERLSIQVLDLPTAFWHGLADRTLPESVRLVILGGERAQAKLAARWLAAPSRSARLVNSYGPTEACVVATAAFFDSPPQPVPLELSIGAPLAHVRAYALDPWLRAVPVGAVGELYLGGESLARGYLGLPAATAARFLPNPFARRPGERLYRSGDLVRPRGDGSFVFAGRLDRQLKWRGFRIEPSEIEAALLADPRISAAHVAPSAEPEPRLAAYLQLASTQGPPSERHERDRQAALESELRARLRGQLPPYMLPSVYLFLAAFPLNTQGKLHQAALPQPPPPEQATATPERPGRDPLEAQLAAYWCELLGQDPDSDSDFFALGGHSLALVRLATRIEQGFSLEIPLRLLFESPIFSAQVQKIRELQESKSETPPLIKPQEPKPCAIPTHNGDRPATLPLSFEQERLWFLEIDEALGPVYNIAGGFRLRGRLVRSALATAFEQLIAAHESLRTGFYSKSGVPFARIRPPWSPLQLESHLGLSPEARDQRLHQELELEANHPFRLDAEPLFRARLLCFGEHELDQDHGLLIALHHIVADGWSSDLIWSELAHRYAELAAGRTPAVEPAPQFADYVAWSRARAQTLCEQQLPYWLAQLTPLPEPLRLPSQRRHSSPAHRGAVHEFRLEPEWVAALDQLGQRRGATRSMVQLALFALFLARYSGRSRFTIGLPYANRNHPGLDRLVGFLVNLLVLKIELSCVQDFSTLLDQVRQQLIQAMAHADLPYERLASALSSELGRSTSLFQQLFAYENQSQIPAFPELQLETVPLAARHAKYELSLVIRDHGQKLHAHFEYDSDCFLPEEIAAFADFYRHLAERASASPTRPVREWEPLPAAQRRLRRGWADASWIRPAETTIHERFAALVAQRPQEPALVEADGRVLAFAEVADLALEYEQALADLGVGAGDRVALQLEPGANWIAAMLAILARGAAYVPIDPATPKHRKDFQLRDSRAMALIEAAPNHALSENPADPASPPLAAPTRLASIRPLSQPSSRPASPGSRLSHPELPAYLIYTSGSTGQPKGVLVPHRAVLRLAIGNPMLPIRAGQRMTQLFSPAFDAAVKEVWGTLLNGATLVFLGKNQLLDFDQLGEFLRERRIDVLDLPTALVHALAQSRPEILAQVSVLIFGGEAAQASLLQPLLAQERPPLVLNAYGPTENGVDSSCADLRRFRCLEGAAPIGQPVSGTSLHLLDSWLQAVPLGAVGELYTGGAGLALGYFDRPELSAERFVPDPFSPLPGQRLYRSGDQVYQRADGALVFVGRIDGQVKLRGYRLELGEVAAALARQPGIREATATLRHHDGEASLVGYYVLEANGHPESDPVREARLRAALTAELPSYMVPTDLLAIAALPLNANGKVDFARLPDPYSEQVSASSASAGEAEEASALGGESHELALQGKLAAIWSLVLGKQNLNGSANFFQLGGHSLAAVRVTALVAERLGLSLPVRALFEAPQLRDYAARLQAVAEREAQRDREQAAEPQEFGTDSEPHFASGLSAQQERLWFLERFEDTAGAYEIGEAWLIEGELNPEALEQAFELLCARHEQLRVAFPERAGQPAKVAADPGRLERGVAAAGTSPESALRALWESRPPFNLEKGPLWFRHLLCLGSNRYLLLSRMHHLISDAWSAGILAREWTLAYRALTRGERPLWPAPPLAFADYLAHQRRLARNPEPLRAWCERLTGAPTAIDLPLDRPRGSQRSWAGSDYVWRAEPELSRQIAAFAAQSEVTPFLIWLAGLAATLQRHGAGHDLVIGTPVANRQLPGLAELVGFFVNTLALRCDLSGTPGLRELLGRLRERLLEGLTLADVPFDQVVRAVQPERRLQLTPLFQVMLVVQEQAEPLQLAGCQLQPLALPSKSAKFDLTLFVRQDQNGCELTFEYCELFDQETVAGIAERMMRLLRQALAEPERPLLDLPIVDLPILDLPILDPPLINVMNQDPTSFPPQEALQAESADLAQLLAAATRRFAQLPALRDGQQQLTYAELGTRVESLAAQLIAAGAGEGRPIALCTGRGAAQLLAVAAILAAGAPYLPLDPDWPELRLLAMLEEAGPQLLLYDDHAPHALLEQARRLGQGPESQPQPQDPQNHLHLIHCAQPHAARPSSAHGSGLRAAYILFTSGSTGRPKGVTMTHQALAQLIHWQIHQSEPALRTLQFSSLCFDVSFQELFATWCSGGELVVVDSQTRREPPALVRHLQQNQIQRLFLPFVALESLAEAALQSPNPALPQLRQLITAGEQLRISPLLRAFFSAHPHCQLVNQYGPSETHVATSWTLSPDPAHWPELPPIGTAILGTRAYLLDSRMQPLPDGVTGQLYLGGLSPARGYWNRPDLTAERFLPDPFALQPGARMYQTGDLARRHRQGQLSFLGRADGQLKIQGYRIEPGEIENQLVAHPAVARAAVTARPGSNGPRLIAYWLAASKPAIPNAAGPASHSPASHIPDSSELHAWLSQRLPAYAVPATYLQLEAFPLTRTGKLDLRALPDPPQPQEPHHRPSAFPDPCEQLLAILWARLLQSPTPARDSDFFACGGHSLLATRLVAAIRASFQVELPLRALFEAPRFHQLAERIRLARQQAHSGFDSAPPEPHPAPIPEPHPAPNTKPHAALSFSQRRFWFLHQLGQADSTYHLPLALLLHGPLHPSLLDQALCLLLQRHQVLRSLILAPDGQPFSLLQPTPASLLQQRSVSLAHPSSLRQDFIQRAQAFFALPFQLQEQLPIRALLLHYAPHSHGLILVIHHIAADGWSLGLLAAELGQTYAALLAGQPPQLEPLVLQFGDFAAWQAERLAHQAFQHRLERRLQRLRLLPPLFQLEGALPRPPQHSNRGATLPFRLSAAELAQLDAFASQFALTRFMLLFAAFALALARAARLPRFAIAVPIAQRTRAEFEPLIGCFVNTLVLPVDLAGPTSLHAWLDQVREECLAAFEDQELPFDLLVEALNPLRDPGYPPLAQVGFVYQNFAKSAPSLPELACEPLAFEDQRAKLDLSLFLEPSESGLEGGIEFDAGCYEPWQIELLLKRFRQALMAFATPDQDPAELELRDPSEIAEVEALTVGPALYQPESSTTAGGDTTRKWSGAWQRLQALAQEAPTAIALVEGERGWTRAELLLAVECGAQALAARGVRAETRVALQMARGAEWLLALLAVYRAGGAWASLAPNLPALELNLRLAELQPVLVLEQGAFFGLFDSSCLSCQSSPASPAQKPELPDPAQIPAACLAYLVYTSGSSGRPKPVAVTRANLDAYLHSLETRALFRPDDRILQQLDASFDAALEDSLAPLLAGACVIIAPPGSSANPDQLMRALLQNRANVLMAVPSLHRAFLESRPECYRQLRLAGCGGEALSLELAQRLADAGVQQLLNSYGPSETTVTATSWLYSPGATRIHIGKPIPGAYLRILDAAFRPCGLGESGELLIGGAGLSRGYFGRPELSAEKFIPDPFSSQPGARLYRSGDLVRLHPNAGLEFLGRLDRQLKWRGYRIEPAEIERALLQDPRIAEAHVALTGEPPQLVAYYTLTTTAPGDPGKSGDSGDFNEPSEPSQSTATGSPSAGQLQERLAQHLPKYLLPSRFVELASFPRLASGKLDPGALPEPSAAAIAQKDEPRDEIELRLLRHWRELLGRPELGIHADFFAAGGHSLLAIQLITRLRREFGREFELTTLLTEGTVAGLAKRLRSDAALPRFQAALPLSRLDEAQRPFFCAVGAGGTALYFQPLAAQLSLPLVALQNPWLDPHAHQGEEFPPRELGQLAARQIQAIRAIQAHGPYRLGGHSFGGILAHEIALQLAESGEPIEWLVILDTAVPRRLEVPARSWSERQWLAKIAANIARLSNTDLALDYEDLAQQEQEQAYAKALKALKEAGLVPTDLETSQLRAYVRVAMADTRAMRPPRSGKALPLAVIRAEEPFAPEDLAHWELEPEQEQPDLGWSNYAEGAPQLASTPGNHRTMFSPAHAKSLARAIESLFNR